MKFKKPHCIAITMIAVFVIAIVAVIYITHRPLTPIFSIRNISFRLGEDKRSIEFTVSVERGCVKLKDLFVNETIISEWETNKHIACEGEEIKCFFYYEWKMNRDYQIKLTTTDGQYTILTIKSPKFEPSLNLIIKDINITTQNPGFIQVRTKFEVSGHGIDSLHMLLFAYISFNNASKNTYIFYDPDYMAEESIRRADALISYFNSCGLPIYKLDYQAIEALSRWASSTAKRCNLIIVNPLKDSFGRRIFNALPAPLLDPNENGFLRDDSKYGKSFVYDLMKDEGLTLITVGSIQPHKKILYKDGICVWARDSFEPFDVHFFLTNALNKETIVKNLASSPIDYSPVRISCTLGISHLEASMWFDKDVMEKYGLEYYAYGDYRPRYGDPLNLTQPVFIRVGKGGWLAIGDEGLWLNDGQLAHDLFMVCLQAVWDSNWIPYGWYWDNCCTFYSCQGLLKVEDCLETEFIPLSIINEKVLLRIIAIAYSSDLNTGIIVERTMETTIRGNE